MHAVQLELGGTVRLDDSTDHGLGVQLNLKDRLRLAQTHEVLHLQFGITNSITHWIMGSGHEDDTTSSEQWEGIDVDE